MSMPIPITTPSRTVLLHRLQLVRSLVGQRPCDPETKSAILAVLNGSYDHLADPTGGKTAS